MAKYTIEERIKIGQETFYRLLETEYGENVRDEMAKKYGVTIGNISTYLNMFKINIIEPKPTEEELNILQNYYSKRLQKLYPLKNNGVTKNYSVALSLLKATTEEDYKTIYENYNKYYVKSCIKEYCEKFPDSETLLMAKFEKLLILIQKNQKPENKEITKESSYDRITNLINAYLNSNDYYPNYIFKRYRIDNGDIRNILKKAKEENNEKVLNLIEEYRKTLQKRELDFKKLCLNLYYMIENNQINILDFYRLTHMPINKFKMFIRVANLRHQISGDVYLKIDNFLSKYYLGSHSYETINEAIENLNYNYNGNELDSEMIKTICAELFEQDIPIDRNSIILTFQEKVNQRVNKR